ncbi:transporter substrate-binding domain-containing protein [Brenneria goodwinii]|uniref:transporter substrate-binding domain-containing protein n=1 Tax=Brenneria goodwinii TaxID=1109412 RepID=UPI000EF190D7|nr:transporter substrate-binding domain-containing protein [Brenneria goodwinii]MCG8158335.1 transporter substrate-binding domain-containing protein [Brenneria goodwinii]MCG8161147.1 transporter substrate-binding domain-containing protein [Brenneria goodwinii]MCG8165435.1 transporter substrate-binding domain-containing protein [Brenneria goodwinii]MCG8169918.1 transporter substrate-binding domain-containing protein [Brenneria goodwinii]MCG8177110.1 transporter substrate-binding domain-containi
MSVTRRALLNTLFAIGLSCVSGLTFAQQGEPIKAVTDATFPPLEFMENNKFSGFDIELVEAIGKQLNRPVQWTNVDFKGLIPNLTSQRADIAVSGIYITPERAQVVNFTKPYLTGGLVVVVKEDNDAIKTHDDLKGKSASVQVGTKSVAWLHSNMPQVRLVEVEKNQQMFNLVSIGRVDAAVTGKPAAFQYARTKGGVRILADQLTSEEYGIAVRKDLPQLRDDIDSAVETLKTNGVYQSLMDKWFPAH